ncbi:hypothetical protein ACIO3O_03765 [Streptomyces sp. NPDC087440]|uniref:hypothetical protein n=1 Tax=Streptomyces sp. NPDC087440 TaxID=3365790 RepID=UPI0037F159CF
MAQRTSLRYNPRAAAAGALLLGGAALFAAPAAVAAESPSPSSSTALPAPVQRAVSAVNDGDNKAFVAAFTKDALVNDSGRDFKGHAAIKGWSDKELIGAKAKLTVNKVKQDARDKNTVTVTAEVKSDGFNGPSDFAFTVDGDKLSAMRITG